MEDKDRGLSEEFLTNEEETEVKLGFIRLIGEETDGYYRYEFIFTDSIDVFWGENFEQKLETKADKAAVEAELATKPSIQEVNTALAGKVDRSTFDDAMALKADQETMTTMLNQKVDKTTYNSEIASIWAELERLKNIIENH